MSMSPGSKVILERRSSAYFSFTSASSSLMTVRSTPSSPRMASRPAIVSRSVAISVSRSTRARRVSCPRRRSRMCSAWTSEKLKGSAGEPDAGGGPVFRPPDEGDDLVDDVDGLEQALDDVGPVLRLLEPELRPATDHVDLVIDVGLQGLHQVQGARHAVDEGHRVHGEVRLQRRVLVQVVEDDEGGSVLLELDDQPGLAPSRLVVDVGDPLDGLGLHEVDDPRCRDRDGRLVRHLGDDDLVAAAAAPLFDLAHGPEPDGALAGAVGVEDPLATHDQRAGGEVGTLHELHEVVGRGLGVVDEVDGGVDHLAQVVGRDVGGHAHRDALAAVHQQVREPRRQDHRLGLVAGVVVGEVDGVLVDAVEHPHGQLAQPGFGVAAGSRTEVGAAEVAVPVDEGVAQGEVLGHAHEGVVDGPLAVGVVLAHDVAGDAGALHVGAVGAGAQAVHAEEDPAVHRLQAIARVRQGAGRDDRHGVVQEGGFHLLLDLDGLDGGPDRAVAVVGGGVV